MNTIYLLTVTDDSDFGVTVHQSAHTTQCAAIDHADLVAVPAARDAVDPEYHASISYEVQDIPLIN
jgi:hypothetical protein